MNSGPFQGGLKDSTIVVGPSGKAERSLEDYDEQLRKTARINSDLRGPDPQPQAQSAPGLAHSTKLENIRSQNGRADHQGALKERGAIARGEDVGAGAPGAVGTSLNAPNPTEKRPDYDPRGAAAERDRSRNYK
jgi:hypothetical protein